MSEDVTLDEFVNKNGNISNEPEKPELIQGVAWSTIDSVPDDWTVNNVESDIEILAGNNFSSDHFTDEDGIPLIRIRDLAEDDTTVYYDGDYDSRYLISQQDLLVGMDGEFEPHLWTGPQALLNQRVCKIEPNERYNKIFFRYAIEKPLFYIQKSIAGTTVKHLSQSNINDLNLPTPSLEQQRKIATVLYNVDQAIQKTEEIIEQTSRVKEGLVNEIVINGIGNESFQSMRVGPHEFSVPEHWEIVSITEACENLDSERIPVSQSDREDMQGEIPYYGASGCVDYVDDYLFDEPLILLAEDGENLRSRTQRVAFKITGKSWVNNHAHVLRPRNEFKIDYLVEYLERLDYRPHVSGSAQPKLNQTMLNKISVPKPPVEEQEEIASILNNFKNKIEKESEYRDRLNHLKHGLMQDLLSGTVRTTNTNIEVPEEIAQHG